MATFERIANALVHEEAGKRRLAVASFLESTIVPIPLETLVAPLMVAHPKRSYWIAHAIFAGCLVGALVFYLLGNLLFDPVVAPVLDGLGLMETYERTQEQLSSTGFFWAVFLVSLTPLPFQLATIGAGTMGGNVLLFMLGVAASRGLRYYGLAFLANRFGDRLLAYAGSRRRLVIGGIAVLLALWLLTQLVI